MKKSPMKLDEEELQILHDFERGEFQSIRNFQSEKQNWKRLLAIPSKRTNESTFGFRRGILNAFKCGRLARGSHTRPTSQAPFTNSWQDV
jgi:hypothetical protein